MSNRSIAAKNIKVCSIVVPKLHSFGAYNSTFISDKSAFKQFLLNKFKRQQNFNVHLDLWGALKGRMAVRFETSWQDESGQGHKSYGVGVFQFNDDGLAEQRYASEEAINIKQ